MEKSEPEGENSDWILESLVTYLRSSVWTTPILNFMEQQSVVFEGDDEHEEEYHVIHERYRNLVDVMLGSYMDDLELQPEHLERALSQVQPSVRSAALQELLEPVRAAGDYEFFKLLMKVKNEQLHYQALELLRRHENVPAEETQLEHDFAEDDINEAIRQSLAELEKLRSAEALEERDVERALAISTVPILAQTVQQDLPTVQESASIPNEDKKVGRPGQPDPAEVEQRRALLRAQRDKILSLKRQQRQEQLNSQQEERDGSGPVRPKSGQAARDALAGQSTATVDERTIQYRRLLMQKIKEEVEDL